MFYLKIDLYCLITGEAIYEIGEAHKEIHSRVEENVGSAYSLMEILLLIIFVFAIVRKKKTSITETRQKPFYERIGGGGLVPALLYV